MSSSDRRHPVSQALERKRVQVRESSNPKMWRRDRPLDHRGLSTPHQPPRHVERRAEPCPRPRFSGASPAAVACVHRPLMTW